MTAPTLLIRPPAAWPRRADREAKLRTVLSIGLAGIVLIHALDAVNQWTHVRYLFWMYVGLIAAGTLLAGAAIFSQSRWVFAASTGLTAAVLGGYMVSRTMGLPANSDDIGNWTEPLGMASVVVETIVLAAAVLGVRSRQSPSRAGTVAR